MHSDEHAPTDEHPEGSNRSTNRAFGDVVAARFSRRSMLGRSGLAGVGMIAATGSVSAFLASCAPSPGDPGTTTTLPPTPGLLGFTSVAVTTADAITVPPGYTAEVLIPWGTPLSSSGPAWNPDASNTAAEQAQQIGMHHDGMHYFPLESGAAGSREGLLVLNHEYVDQILLNTDGIATITQAKVDKALAAHGVTVVRIEERAGTWVVVDSPYNRRVTGTTPVTFSGPVTLDHAALQSNNAATGTLNNCSHGYTPWGTYLACEENWNGYFGTENAAWSATPEQARYGISKTGFSYKWHQVDPRFDVAVNANELNRFGWVVEIDPFSPGSTPVKRTALGRIKHEGATVTESFGHAVVYTGDDEAGDYIYRFVSADPWELMRSEGTSPLDEGTLSVARFDSDGSGRWLRLVHGQGPLTMGNGWADQADVLLRTRQAADAVGATKMDRPEWITVHPDTGEVFVTLTNGSAGPTAANPRLPNPYGHIIKWRATGNDHRATTFEWDIWVLAGDPQYDPQVTINGDIYGSPDGLWIDPDGRLWIQTDISNSSQLRADRGYDRIGNNQMLAADPVTGETRRFLVGPAGCEVTGVITTPDQQTMFVNIQHPGESTNAVGAPSVANPRAVSNWPDFDPAGRPRAATVVVRKIGGGIIGT